MHPQVKFLDQSLHLSIDRSASPVVYPLAEVKKVSSIQVNGSWKGNLNLSDPKVQGQKKHDDFLIRLGLIVAGEQKPTVFQKLFAPQWVKTLFDLGKEKNMGVDRIAFFSLGYGAIPEGFPRTHPASDLITEEIVGVHPAQGGEWSLKKEFTSPLSVLGIWISSDGDDTKSKFDLWIKKIAIE
jgi:hypothetical protein